MFKQLTNLSHKRTLLQAVGFYVAYLLLTMVVAMGLAAVLGTATGNADSYAFGMRIGTVISMIMSLALSLAILHKKKLTNNFVFILLAFIAMVLANFGGGLLGLIIPTYLSTK